MTELEVKKILPNEWNTTDTGFYLIGNVGIIVTRVDGIVTYNTKNPSIIRRIGYSTINRNKLLKELEKGKIPEDGLIELVSLGETEKWPSYKEWGDPFLEEDTK
jgi:hypothetical protein